MAALADPYVPDFLLSIGGQPIPATLRALVTGVRFEESLDAVDRVEVSFADPAVQLVDSPQLDLHVDLDLSMGYLPAGLRPMFSGEITGVEPSFPSSGMPSLSVVAHGKLERLTRGTKQRGFPWYLPDSVIATIVAAENFLLSVPDPAASVASALNLLNQRPRYQHRMSDHDFLRQIAAEYGFDMWVDGDQLNFKLLLRDLPPPDIELAWGRSLLDFTPRRTSIGQLVGVTISVYIQSIKLQLAVTVGWDGDHITIRVAPALFGEQSGAIGGTLSLPDVPMDTPVDAIKWALGELRRRLNRRTTARGSAIGDPRLRAGDTITISGVGDRFSGSNYRITGTVHSIDASGYRTTFDLRQELI